MGYDQYLELSSKCALRMVAKELLRDAIQEVSDHDKLFENWKNMQKIVEQPNCG